MFLPISILAYGLNGGAILIDKISLRNFLPNPIVYTFYINILALFFTPFFIPFGFYPNTQTLVLSGISGFFFVLALYSFFQSLKISEATVAGPIVGALNPLLTLLFGFFSFNQTLSITQLVAFSVVILGSIIISFNMQKTGKVLANQAVFMILSGVFYAISYIMLKQAFTISNFITPFVITRIFSAIFVIPLIFIPNIKHQILSSKIIDTPSFSNTRLLLLCGQSMAALGGVLLNFAVFLSNPALVNAFFGVQNLVIITAALLLTKKYPNLLDENFTKKILLQKILGAIVLSVGVFLLSI